MRAFIAWVLERRYWLALLAIVFGQLFPPVGAALLVADAARQGPQRALPLAALVLAGVVLLGLGGGFLAMMALVSGVVTVSAGFGLGALIFRARSLELAFQVTVLAAMLIVALVTLLGPAPEVMAEPVVAELAQLMTTLGASIEQLEGIRGLDPVLLLGSMFAGALLQVLAALMLGYWWFGLVDTEAAFGAQFRALRLGRIVGILSIAVLAASLALRWPVVGNLTPLVAIGLLFQGLAVMHAWVHAKGWGPLVAGLVYASVVTPLVGLTVTALCAAGLLDNFFSLRRPLQSGA